MRIDDLDALPLCYTRCDAAAFWYNFPLALHYLTTPLRIVRLHFWSRPELTRIVGPGGKSATFDCAGSTVGVAL